MTLMLRRARAVVVGDSAPKLTSGDAAFLVMVGFFLLAQVAYIAAFRPYRARSVLHVHRARCSSCTSPRWRAGAACAAGAAGMLVPVLVYGACLGTMAVLATGVNQLTAVGGASSSSPTG